MKAITNCPKCLKDRDTLGFVYTMRADREVFQVRCGYCFELEELDEEEARMLYEQHGQGD